MYNLHMLIYSVCISTLIKKFYSSFLVFIRAYNLRIVKIDSQTYVKVYRTLIYSTGIILLWRVIRYKKNIPTYRFGRLFAYASRLDVLIPYDHVTMEFIFSTWKAV